MSVAIGFQCKDGVVLAADSELSTPFAKYQGDKAWLYRYPRGASRFSLEIGIVGAGDAAFIQYASERIDSAIDAEMQRRKNKPLTMPEVNALIQGVLNDLHQNHLYVVPPSTHEVPEVQLIVGILLRSGRNRLAKTYLTSLTKVWNYEAVGIGSALANFIIKRFYGGRLTVAQAVFVAAQALMHVKANVPRCGGTSKVIVMYKRGAVGWAQQQTVVEHEGFLNQFDDAIAPVFFGGADLSISNVEFHKRVDELSARLKSFRKVEEVRDLAAQVREDVKIVMPPGEVTISGAFLGPTATLSPPSVQQEPPAKKPTRKSRKNGRKSRPV